MVANKMGVKTVGCEANKNFRAVILFPTFPTNNINKCNYSTEIM